MSGVVDPNDPSFENVTFRDLDLQYMSGVKSECLEPEDVLEFHADGRITILFEKDGREVVYLPAHLEAYSIAKRTFRRRVKITPKRG